MSNNIQPQMQGNAMRHKPNHMVAVLRRRFLLPFFALGMLLLLGIQSAQAVCIKRADFQEKFVEMSMGRVLIPNDLPVGSTIATREFNIPIAGALEVAFNCGRGGGSVTGARLQSAQSYGNDIYSTNVPGVGIRLSRRISDRTGPGTWRYYPQTLSFAADSDPAFYPPSSFRVELIKIAPETGNGPLSSGIYTQYIGDGGGGSVLTTQLTGQGITIVTPSCTVDAGSKNIMVNFGKIPASEFRGRGSTAAERKFEIKLNCKSGLNIQNTILISIDANPDSPSESGVLKITPGPRAATGVGIQLLDAQSKPVKFGEDTVVGPSKDGAYILSYAARYFQNAERILPGRADGVATFSVEYK